MMSGDVGLIIECVVLSYGMSMCCCGLVLLVRIGHTNFVMCDLCVYISMQCVSYTSVV